MRVTIDLMKKSTQIIDLSNVINPRVGDDDLLLPLHIGYGDNLFDMRGKDVEFLSNDPNQKSIYIAGTCNTNTPGDNLYMGDLTFRFPAGTFQADGTYDPDQTMFRIVDKATQKVISSVNVKITVMKNALEFNFDPDKSSYDSRAETMLQDFHDKGQSMLDEIKDLNNQAKSNVSGDTAATANAAKQQANANAGDISDLKGEVAGARGRFSDLPGREDAQDTAISQKESIANANANYTALQQKDAQQDAILAQKAGKFELEDKLAQMSLEPEAFENEAALRAKYPQGNNQLNVTTDNGHLWIWIDGDFKDCGQFQTAGIGDNTVTTSKLADSSVIPSKTSFISKNPKSINLFDLNNTSPNIFYDDKSYKSLDGYVSTNDIPVKTGDVVNWNFRGYGWVLDSQKNPIEYMPIIAPDSSSHTVSNANASFVRIAIPTSDVAKGMVTINEPIPPNYQPFLYELADNIKINESNLENASVKENEVAFLKRNGPNKFDLNNTSPNIIYDDKSYKPLDGYVSTNDIPVKAGDVVNWNFRGYGWVLDSQKNPIEYMPIITNDSSSHTVSNANASFVRIAIPTSDVAKGMVTINEPIPTSYQPFDLYELTDNISINESNVIKSQTNVSGKTVSIVGDSYSAFTGWVPEGNNISFNGTYNGVTSVSSMWWYKVIQKFNMSLMLNESWSGSTIGNTGYNASDATETSFLTRITKRYGATNTLGQKPQVLFILGGLNDTWAKSPLGNAKYSDWTTDDLKTTLGAYSKMVNDILLYNPGIEIINFEYAEVSQEIRDGKALICEHFGVKNVPISTVDSLSGHPTTTGMQQIADQIITALNV